jgi:sulfur carrier protein
MTVTINGERREIPDGLTVAALVEHLGLAGDRLAIERNLDILQRQQWKQTQVLSNDSFEIVHLVGGGTFCDCVPAALDGPENVATRAAARICAQDNLSTASSTIPTGPRAMLRAPNPAG